MNSIKDSQTCQITPCTAKWTFSTWSRCSAQCPSHSSGTVNGEQTRAASCRRIDNISILSHSENCQGDGATGDVVTPHRGGNLQIGEQERGLLVQKHAGEENSIAQSSAEAGEDAEDGSHLALRLVISKAALCTVRKCHQRR
ncbi:Oidioi.mRNA.OKI2018_I69.chr2.g7863.t1.cds [Oikopleura dioica]|uniref:Oidioi.mRNA.OKI2018_I69.chr2.g7863.t1.cds n=1 Tax=Oikopleura dioica TaxID=34765 RepID=A0ABN7TDW7_OIKDI|nr:Oidioi.mRNA.OKI2018_I69.chr2.g7863.t1.cds [Oikopleura dioica]